jgi:hypothetical protein
LYCETIIVHEVLVRVAVILNGHRSCSIFSKISCQDISPQIARLKFEQF